MILSRCGEQHVTGRERHLLAASLEGPRARDDEIELVAIVRCLVVSDLRRVVSDLDAVVLEQKAREAPRRQRKPVDVGDARDELLAIRDGAASWEEIDARRKGLHAEFDAAFAATTLPDRPDYAAIDAFLIRARRSAT